MSSKKQLSLAYTYMRISSLFKSQLTEKQNNYIQNLVKWLLESGTKREKLENEQLRHPLFFFTFKFSTLGSLLEIVDSILFPLSSAQYPTTDNSSIFPHVGKWRQVDMKSKSKENISNLYSFFTSFPHLKHHFNKTINKYLLCQNTSAISTHQQHQLMAMKFSCGSS